MDAGSRGLAPLSDLVVTVVGSGTPIPDASGRRWGNATLLEYGGTSVLVDCGPQTTARLIRLGIPTTSLDGVFISHHHSDHVLDLPTLLLTRFDMSIGRESTMMVAGPAGTSQLVDRLVGTDHGAFYPDLVARTSHPLSLGAYQDRGGELPRRIAEIDSRDLNDKDECDIGAWTVTCAKMPHVQPYHESLGYRFESDAGSIVFSGDTSPCDELVELAQGCDLFVVECIRTDEHMQRRAYGRHEVGALDTGKLAAAAGAKRVLAVHQTAELDHPTKMAAAVSEIRQNYNGPLYWGIPFLRLVMPVDVS